MKKIRNTCLLLASFILLLFLGTTSSKAGDLYLNDLDFKAQIQKDGSMVVTETWNIEIEDTNTLYKSFQTDSNKYSSITNVSVKEITQNEEKTFRQISNWAYHAPKDCFYGAKNEKGDFEIGWGVDLEDDRDNRKYQIQYTVQDAITKYQDYAELYWQFVGADFEVNASKITGTIYLPKEVSEQDQIKVWGHTKDMNGTIYATGNNKIEFKINRFKAGKFVEIRALFPSEQIITTGRIENTEILQKAIEEETTWANEANKQREKAENSQFIYLIVFSSIYFVLCVILLVFLIKKIRKLKEMTKRKKIEELTYYHDIPRNEATPTQALSILEKRTNGFLTTEIGNLFSAILLDLSLKEFLHFEVTEIGKKKENIQIELLKVDKFKMKDLIVEEKIVYQFIYEASHGKSKITVNDLKKYIKRNSSKVEKLKENLDAKTQESLVKENMVDLEQKKVYQKYDFSFFTFLVLVIMGFIISMMGMAFIGNSGIDLSSKMKFIFMTRTLIVSIIVFLVLGIMNLITNKMILNRIPVYTDKALEEKEQWKGLKKFMEDFSTMDSKELPELILWEKYMVYATAFGIADKVIKQLRMVYPNMDETSSMGTYPYLYLMMYTDFNHSFTHSISSSMSSSYTSATGGGGGFSGGGGFGRRPVVAEVEDNNLSFFKWLKFKN